jgi:galactoside O-acetyltransferase
MNSKFLKVNDLKKIKFKKKGFNIKISKNVTIIGAKNISIGSNVRIDDYTVISSNEGSLKIGSNVHIGAQSYLGCAGKIQIGNDVNLSQGVRIYSKIDDYLKYRKGNKTILGFVEIDNNVIIGSGSVIVGQCKIAEGATVGALSLVKSNLKKWSINGGIPAKFIKTRKK